MVLKGIQGKKNIKRKIWEITGVYGQTRIFLITTRFAARKFLKNISMKRDKRNFLYPEEASKLLDCITDKRDRMYVALGLYLGTRHNESAQVKWSDLLDGGNVVKQFRLHCSKQKKWRRIKISPEMKEVIEFCYEGQPLTWLCVPSNWRGATEGKDQITSQAGRNLLEKYYKLAGIDAEKVEPGTHALRRTFGKNFFQSNGADFEALQMLSKYLDHANTDVTTRYIGLLDEDFARMSARVSYKMDPNSAAVRFLIEQSSHKLALFLRDRVDDLPELLKEFSSEQGKEFDYSFLCS
jgi:integrase